MKKQYLKPVTVEHKIRIESMLQTASPDNSEGHGNKEPGGGGIDPTGDLYGDDAPVDGSH